MAMEFNRNLFIMLFTIMLGVLIITYFVADIVNRSKIETLTTEYKAEISTITEKNENFINSFFKASVVIDQAREDRAFGNYHFDLAFLWYESALAEKNALTLELYKTRGIDNCTYAMPYYTNSQGNYEDAVLYFIETKANTTNQNYINITELYISLSDSGSKLSALRYEASMYLMYLTENLTFDAESNNVTYLVNVTQLLTLFTNTIEAYKGELENYNGYQNDIDEYEFFDEIR